MSGEPVLEIISLRPELKEALQDLFAEIHKSEDSALFHPHPFTNAEGERLCSYQGEDQYYALVYGGRILGYGMLRGWDEGYGVPSLGIYVRSEARGAGIGKLLMQHMHVSARLRGATRIRLKVYRHNPIPIRMYRELGYIFEGEEGEQLVGIFTFPDRRE